MIGWATPGGATPGGATPGGATPGGATPGGSGWDMKPGRGGCGWWPIGALFNGALTTIGLTAG